ncbi:MAG: gamma carbonic anhydrase family protein [Spirochaetales bacterium]|nr:gamma carbonic anhydrase family protein [Spirochaetales bacterium]
MLYCNRKTAEVRITGTSVPAERRNSLIIPFGHRTPLTDGAVFIAPNASIVGQVVLGENVSIWFGAVLRADFEEIRIGCNTNIQDNTVLHVDKGFPLTVGDYVTVGHGAVLHGCTIGGGCIVGMGAVILNGAVIGENSIVGAGALVTERDVFPPGSLIVGHPAVLKRPLKPALVNHLKDAAVSYVEKAREAVKACR